MKGIKAIFVLFFVLIASQYANAASIDAYKHDETVYIVKSFPSEVLRYDMGNNRWLSSIPLDTNDIPSDIYVR